MSERRKSSRLSGKRQRIEEQQKKLATEDSHRPVAGASAEANDCGILPTTGDLYGGSHYSKLCSSNMTLQGKAMQAAALRFGDGDTLPFTPCKKGYKPFASTKQIMYACPLHDKERRQRVKKEGGLFRKGEVDLDLVFWKQKPPGKSAKSQQEECLSKPENDSATLVVEKQSSMASIATGAPKRSKKARLS
ncbi:expressed unknown protein [Seminavis robusta]|uniref:Uncharacterized protein n=1 Tax=Seminavis robusta TaxID=568900 RepID=A0A9N8DBG0_9STRA|nr:expressed unknown protein [Seminavis robusta]|eukprot:Sro45_g026930.1 n/a (191) ;mRNA; r:73441-74206